MKENIPQISNLVREQLGDWVVVIDDEDNQESNHQIVVEWTYQDLHYLVMSPDASKDPDEWWYATASLMEDGEWQIESLDEDDVIEMIDEWVDEWMFDQSNKDK